jgi:hypothetical protein
MNCKLIVSHDVGAYSVQTFPLGQLHKLSNHSSSQTLVVETLMQVDKQVADAFPSWMRVFEYLRVTHDLVLMQRYQNDQVLQVAQPAALKPFRAR